MCQVRPRRHLISLDRRTPATHALTWRYQSSKFRYPSQVSALVPPRREARDKSQSCSSRPDGVLSKRLPGRIRALKHENREFSRRFGGCVANPSTTSSHKRCSSERSARTRCLSCSGGGRFCRMEGAPQKGMFNRGRRRPHRKDFYRRKRSFDHGFQDEHG